MVKITKEIIKEFTDKYCTNCKAYVVCGAELVGCSEWEKFLKDIK